MSGQKGKVHLGPNVSSSAPPMFVGAWSMVVALWQQYEYYNYSWIISNSQISVQIPIMLKIMLA